MDPTARTAVPDPLRFVLTHLGDDPPAALVVSGGIACGKTTAVARLVDALRARSIPVHGAFAPRVLAADGRTTGYDAVDAGTGSRRKLLRSEPPGEPIGRFYFDADTLRAVREAASRASAAGVVVLDEIGRAELEGGGHEAALRAALLTGALVVVAVRTEFVDRVVGRFGIRHWGELRLSKKEAQ